MSKPMSAALPEQNKIASIAATAFQLASSKNIERLKKETIIETENVNVVENLDSSAVFEKVFKKGINPYRGEILFVNEFQPIATDNIASNDTKSINLNFGNNKVLEVTNVARLIELQQTLRKNAISQSSYLIRRYGNVRVNLSRLVSLMEKQLRNKKTFKRMYTPSLENFKTNLINEAKNNIKNINFAQQVRKLNIDFLDLVSEYVLNKFVAKEIIVYISRLFDFKERIERGLELNEKPLIRPPSYSGLNLKKSKSTNIKNLIGKGRANFSRNSKKSLQGAMLSFGRKNSKNDLNRSNFENLLNLTSHMISVIYCHDTIEELNSTNYVEKENITYGRTGNLKSALDRLGKLTFTGCFTQQNSGGSQTASSEQILNRSNLESIYSQVNVDNNSIATAEMLSAICFSQVSWANFRKKKSNSRLSDSLASLNKFIRKNFVNVTNKPDISLDDKDFKTFLEDDDKKGALFERLFNEKTYKGKKYIPFETNNTLSSNLYDKTLSFPGEEIFFTSAIKNNDSEFSEFKKFTEDIKRLTKKITEELIENLSLDFDNQGIPNKKENTLLNNLNPLTYFNFYLKKFAEDIEKCLGQDEQLEENIVGLSAAINSAGSMEGISESFIASIMGILSKNSAFWANNNWIQGTNIDGFQAGSNVYATVLSECKYRSSNAVKEVLRNTGINDFGTSAEVFGRSEYKFDGDGNDYAFGPANRFDDINGTGKTHSMGVSSEFHFNEKIQDNPTVEDYQSGNYVAADSPEEPMKLYTIGRLNTTAKRALESQLKLEERTITRNSAGGASEGIKILNTTLNSNVESLYENIAGIDGTKSIGVQITNKSLYMSSILFESGLNKHGSSATVQIPEISSDNANKINTIDNMFFFKKDTNENIKGTGFEGISFLQNDMPGRSGETFKTSTIQRSLVFYIFALGMLAGTQRMSAISSQNGGLLKIGIKKSRIKGLIKALKGEELPANAVESEKHAYEEAIERIDLVRSKIITRQDYILRCIAIINDKVDALDATYKALINYSQGTTAGASFPFVKAKLDENNFFDDTFSLLNASHKDYFSNSFLRNFCMSNNVRYSYFLESDTFHINDLKIMYKLFSQPGYGFLKNEKLGRKNIYHIGMPLGLLEYLRREAYKETGDEDYLDSSLITISVYKNNQLSTETKYLPKQFVFDASKHVLPFYCNHLGNTRYSRHVSRMTDDLSLKKIIENIEMYVFNEGLNFGFKSNGYGSKGIVGNKTSDLSNNYENDDQFAKDVAMNQISDYYLKLYTNLTTSIEINESMFPVDSNKSFTGNLDNSKANEFKNSIIQKILLAHPKITETEFQSERFFRAANSLNNSILLSSKNRLTEMLSVGCFERVFSILINERDFLIDDDNVNDIYKDSPSVNITSKIQRTQVNPFYVSRIKSNTIKNYLREINDKHTSMSGFSIDIGLLKKW